jgi:hypothetical protein
MACPAFVKSKIFRIASSFVLIVLLAVVAYGLYLFNLKHADLSKVKPAFIVSSGELYSAFQTDETAATAKYAGKVVQVSGNVASIEYGSADSTLSVTLHEAGELSGVICTFSGIKDISQVIIKPGDLVNIRGECSGMLMDVLLNNCALLEKGK